MRQSLRKWNDSVATDLLRNELRKSLKADQRAMLYTGKAQAQQLQDINQWLANLGLSCRVSLKAAQPGYPGTTWLRFNGC